MSSTETSAAAIGSALPCPYGWFWSGGRLAICRPRQTTRELITSPSDSMASAISA